MEMSISLSRGVLRCMLEMQAKCSVESAEERQLIPKRNGAEMESIYRKHMNNQLDIYLFSAQLLGGGELLRFSGSGAGQKR